MLSVVKRIGAVAAVLLGATLMAAGCESSGDTGGAATGTGRDTPAMAAQGQEQAATCEKCKVTWTKVPDTGGKGRVVAYKTRRSHECPDCRNAVNNLFATGKMEHTCKTCGDDALQICEAHAR